MPTCRLRPRGPPLGGGWWRAVVWPHRGGEPAGPRQDENSPKAADIEFFEKQVRPLLADHCHKCHGPDEQKGGLRLDSRSGVLAGGDTGPAVVRGKPGESLLIDAVGYGDLYQMPPTGKLPDAAIA